MHSGICRWHDVIKFRFTPKRGVQQRVLAISVATAAVLTAAVIIAVMRPPVPIVAVTAVFAAVPALSGVSLTSSLTVARGMRMRCA